MKLLKAKKGQVGMGVTIAGMVIMLYVTMIVIGNLQGVGSAVLASETEALAAYNNVTNYTTLGVVLGSIGLLVFAAAGLLGIIGGRRR